MIAPIHGTSNRNIRSSVVNVRERSAELQSFKQVPERSVYLARAGTSRQARLFTYAYVHRVLATMDKKCRPVRAAVSRLLARNAKWTLPHLITCLSDQDKRVRFHAALTFQHIRRADITMLKALIGRMGDAAVYVRYAAIYSFARIVDQAVWRSRVSRKFISSTLNSFALPLLKTFRDPQPDVGATAMLSMGLLVGAYLREFGGNAALLPAYVAAKVVPAILTKLTSRNFGTRIQAVIAMGHMGRVAKPAKQIIQRLAQRDPDPRVRSEASKVLNRNSVLWR